MTLFKRNHFASIDSTNSYLLQLAGARRCHGQVVVADQQTAGRGQRGRRWVAEPGDAVLCSIGWQFPRDQRLDGLSLAVGVMIAEALEVMAPGRLRLKWPNDLLIDETHKLGGILIETVPGPGYTRTAVIGLGLNLRAPPHPLVEPDALPPLGLDACRGMRSDRDEVLQRLLALLEPGLTRFADAGFAPFRDRWWSLRAFATQEVVARMPDGGVVTGRMISVTENGALVIESVDGLHTLVSGEVSLRAARA
jgi:BirA family biotin operon repressor/biotin-[acetyl-CoA-carboxylase] ligase